jgi:hypothetical protein
LHSPLPEEILMFTNFLSISLLNERLLEYLGDYMLRAHSHRMFKTALPQKNFSIFSHAVRINHDPTNIPEEAVSCMLDRKPSLNYGKALSAINFLISALKAGSEDIAYIHLNAVIDVGHYVLSAIHFFF